MNKKLDLSLMNNVVMTMMKKEKEITIKNWKQQDVCVDVEQEQNKKAEQVDNIDEEEDA